MQVELLEVEVEPLAAMRQRFPRALEHIYDCYALARGSIRPFEVRANVFDWEDGMRLVVCRKSHPDRPGRIFLHVSAGVNTTGRLLAYLQSMAHLGRQYVMDAFLAIARERYQWLSGDNRYLDFVSVTGPSIFNLMLEEDG